MEVEGDPIITESAHRHGVDDHDILHAYNNPILIEEFDERLLMFVG